MARSKNTTQSTSVFTDVPQTGKVIRWCKFDKTNYVWFNGIYIGHERRRDDAETLANNAAYDAARREGYRAGLYAMATA